MATVADIAGAVPGASALGTSSVEINGATHDSREVRPGDLFAVLSGSRTDGRKFVDDAIHAGAVALLVEEVLPVRVPQIVVENTREVLGYITAVCHGDPTSRLQVVGITGTNGKTTTAYLVESALAAAGESPGVMGTVEYRVGLRHWEAAHTTPEATVVQSVAREMVEAGATHLVMEASSHGLALGRLNGCRFRVVAFTNLTQDHLDFHSDMQSYGEAKLTLFTSAVENEPEARVVVNVDDPFGSEVIRHAVHPVLTVSNDPKSKADIRPSETPRFSIKGIETKVHTPAMNCLLTSPLLGPHNLSNILLGLGICIQLGIDARVACEGLGGLKAVPGRLERVEGSGDFAVLVDYAHTPDALKRTLKSLRPLTEGRLICVFGCGGDRDPVKRPLMGRSVAEEADIAVVTSDNPRTEEPDAIIEMIIPGVEEAGMSRIDCEQLAETSRGFAVQADRKLAIEAAISAAAPHDTVLIAGKGHEDYQILGTKKIHFDDREEAVRALEARRGGRNG
ncbi:MAG: UDP-N-acetylmuramoyl-L-alanyl-D-glutamate--2,6-diaminopimelate ligase [Deltaproteobacteria bacterium]|nr:UDP-N-acetylmuramoyl-L-alanyl-D-glutamate--2,6-diaminopimelate ligase [Deltaproteobacteria bacterium]